VFRGREKQRLKGKFIRNSENTVKTVNFESKLMRETLPYRVVLPLSYFRNEKEYPVLYLLHGLYGSFENWTTLTDIIEYAKDLELIIINPEGKNNWYTDNPNLESHRFESHILREIIPDAEKRFRIKKSRETRLIGGLSMGGYGAFKFAFRRPELFCYAFSMSGAFDVRAFLENRDNKWEELNQFVAEALTGLNADSIKKEDLFQTAEEMPDESIAKLPRLSFDCGTDDSLLEVNRKYSALLEKRNIKHRYTEHPGGHGWDYWDGRIKSILKGLADGQYRLR